MELWLTLDKKIGKNLYKELELTPSKKIGKSLNKKLKPSFTNNDMHLRKKAAIFIIKTSNKVYEPKTYNKVIANQIYDIRWQQAIEEEIHNLEIYYTWKYKKLLKIKKAIECKWVFKVKYNFNRNIKRFKVHLVVQRFS